MKILNETDVSLFNQLVNESVAMAKYAFSNGIELPPVLIQCLKQLETYHELVLKTKAETIAENASAQETLSTTNPTFEKDLDFDIVQLAGIHQRLSQAIIPAKPAAILLLDGNINKKGIWQAIGPVRLIRNLMLCASLSLVVLLLVSLSPMVNDSANSGSMLKSHGMELFMNELFYMAAAALGASFAALFKLNQYLIEGTYDPKYESSYWIRFALGIIAGVILAEFVVSHSETNIQYLARPTLAMLGGFSSSVVYRILTRLIESVESLLKGDSRQSISAEQQLAKARVFDETRQNKFDVAHNLLGLQQIISDGANKDQLKERITKIIETLVPTASAMNDTTKDQIPEGQTSPEKVS